MTSAHNHDPDGHRLRAALTFATIMVISVMALAACGGGQDVPGVLPTTSAVPRDCTGNDLAVHQTNGMLYTFHDLFVYALNNTSDTACTLSGYPKLSSSTESGSNLQANFDNTTDSPVYEDASTAAVTLQPGASAGLYIGSVGDPGGPNECTAAERVHGTVDITVTGGGSPLTIVSNNCSGQTIYVSPFQSSTALPQVPGESDTSSTSTTTTASP